MLEFRVRARVRVKVRARVRDSQGTKRTKMLGYDIWKPLVLKRRQVCRTVVWVALAPPHRIVFYVLVIFWLYRVENWLVGCNSEAYTKAAFVFLGTSTTCGSGFPCRCFRRGCRHWRSYCSVLRPASYWRDPICRSICVERSSLCSATVRTSWRSRDTISSICTSTTTRSAWRSGRWATCSRHQPLSTRSSVSSTSCWKRVMIPPRTPRYWTPETSTAWKFSVFLRWLLYVASCIGDVDP